MPITQRLDVLLSQVREGTEASLNGKHEETIDWLLELGLKTLIDKYSPEEFK